MPAQSKAQEALDLIERDGFKTGPGWTAAHEICQDHEGEAIFDAIHALLHRIEGDRANAAYWDRRAGTDLGGDGPAQEARRITAMIGTLKT